MCQLRTLRPLQGAIGSEEVEEKRSKIENKPNKECKDLRDDPIMVVKGPDGALFVTDHHHGALAWLRAGYDHAFCKLGTQAYPTEETAFWPALAKDNLVHLSDQNGKPLSPGQLPVRLDLLPDDPYRSLAWRVRKAGGFCRANMQKEFAEFVWADWMRKRSDLPFAAVKNNTEKMLPTAMKAVRSDDAKSVPGYIGHASCPDDR